MFCARLFICASWSPAGKGLTSWLSFVVSSVSLSLSHWYPGSGVVLDCIDSWSLQPYLLCSRITTQWRWWGSNPRPLGHESNTLPLSHCAPFTSLSIVNHESSFDNPYTVCWCIFKSRNSKKWSRWRGSVTSLNKQSRHWRESSSKQCQYIKAASITKCFNAVWWHQSEVLLMWEF